LRCCSELKAWAIAAAAAVPVEAVLDRVAALKAAGVEFSALTALRAATLPGAALVTGAVVLCSPVRAAADFVASRC
jgi:hypothetical protein